MPEGKANKSKYSRYSRKAVKKESKKGKEYPVVPRRLYTNEIWDSDLTILEPRILINSDIVRICDTIQDKAGNNNEFSVIFKGAWTSEGFNVTNEYVVPKQKVAGASVDYKEDLTIHKTNGFNVVVHSHPFESSSFSYNDEKYINSNFVCSILYSQGKFVDARVTMDISNTIRLKIPVKDIVMVHTPLELHDIENIELPVPVQVYDQYSKYQSYYDGWGNQIKKEIAERYKDCYIGEYRS